jgi:hypothetical protein
MISQSIAKCNKSGMGAATRFVADFSGKSSVRESAG